MTFDPTTNRIEMQLLTEEERQALMDWPHGWEGHTAGVWYDLEVPDWGGYFVYRGKPAPETKSEWYTIYQNGIFGPHSSGWKAEASATVRPIAVLRIDTCNGKRTYTEEPL